MYKVVDVDSALQRDLTLVSPMNLGLKFCRERPISRTKDSQIDTSSNYIEPTDLMFI